MRQRLVAAIFFGLTLILGAGGFAAYYHIKGRLYEEYDRGLIQRALSLTYMVGMEAGKLEVDWMEDGIEPPGHQDGMDYYSVWNAATGDVLSSSEDMKPGTLPRPDGEPGRPELSEVTLPNDRPGHCVSLRFLVREDEEDDDEFEVEADSSEEKDRASSYEGPVLKREAAVLVQLAYARVDSLRSVMAAIRTGLTGLWLGGSLFGGLIAWLAVRHGLRPVNELTEQIGVLGAGTTGKRIELRNPPAELAPVVQELNRLLERLESALVRERTLTSNVAHELRTPVAGLLSTLEVTLNRIRSAEEYRECSEECFEIAKRMHWLVNNLLSMTRIEAGRVQLQTHSVRIQESFLEWWTPFAKRADARGLQVEWAVEPESQFETDPEFLRVVMTNLFDNAVSYSPEGGAIRIEADPRGVIQVGNRAVHLKGEVGDRLFEPFWRDRESPEEAGTHAGLGLSLCRKIIELLGGRISAQLRETDRWFSVRLELAVG